MLPRPGQLGTARSRTRPKFLGSIPPYLSLVYPVAIKASKEDGSCSPPKCPDFVFGKSAYGLMFTNRPGTCRWSVSSVAVVVEGVEMLSVFLWWKC